MKRMGILSVLLLLIFTWGCGGGGAEHADTHEAISEHNQEVALDDVLNGTVKYSAADFEQALECKDCHSSIYLQWEGTMHNLSQQDIIYRQLALLASEETGGETDVFCSSCHAPVGVVAREIPPLDNPEISKKTMEGVQCDFCHTVSGAKGIGNAAYLSLPGSVKYGPYSNSLSDYHGSEQSPLHMSSDFCGICHDINHPANGLAISTTYSEWKDSPYATEGTQCQNCHMWPSSGYAGLGGDSREEVYEHTVAGANMAVPRYYGFDEVSQRAEQLLKSAAQLELQLPGVISTGAGDISVKVSNVGAGHMLPTGITYARQMWLELIVTDHNGREIFSSGKTDGNGSITGNAVMYQTVITDKDGNATIKPWTAEKVLSDHRIPPKGSVTEDFRFDIPAGLSGELKVSARLLYRSMPQPKVDELLGAGKLNLPVTEMAAAQGSIDLR